MLGPVLCNLFLSDLFLILNDIDIACYADDITFYKACGNVDATVESLRISAEKLFKRLKHNQGKGNTYRCHLILNTGYSNHVQKSLAKSVPYMGSAKKKL